jgi:hypothetical protein
MIFGEQYRAGNQTLAEKKKHTRYLHVISLLNVSTSDAIAREKTQLLGINYFDGKGEMQREKKKRE